LNSASLVQSSPASVTTDKTDYAPGTIVTITGKGFKPKEDVALTLHERPDQYSDPAFITTADEQGNFIFLQFAPQTIDIGRTFTLTAIGQNSGFTAQTAFTDGAVTVVVNTDTPCAVTGTVSYTNNGGNTQTNVPFTTGTNSATIGTDGSSPVSYTYASPVVCSGGTTYNFVSASPASPFTPSSSTTVTAHYTAPADLIITKTHTGNFTVGQTGATYTITVTNN
jgi:hypothetical protein